MASTPARPCLPVVEQLDDRIHLSVTPVVVTRPGTPPTNAPTIFFGLIKDAYTLIKAESSLVSAEQLAYKEDLLTPTDQQTLFKIDQTFIKIDQVLYKESGQLLSGNLTQDLWKMEQGVVSQDLQSINSLADGLSDNGAKLLPAVQTAEQAVTTFQNDISNFAGFGSTGVTTATFVSAPATSDLITARRA